MRYSIPANKLINGSWNSLIIPSSYKMSIWSLMNFFILIKKVDDQMKLLQHAWSDLLILDHLHQRLHNHLPDESSLPNGQKFDLLSLSLLGCPSLADPLHDVTQRLTEIRFGYRFNQDCGEGHEWVNKEIMMIDSSCFSWDESTDFISSSKQKVK